MPAETTISVPFTSEELVLFNNTMLKITKHSLNHWLTECLMFTINDKLTGFQNPFVQDWRTARPTIKYFENRESQGKVQWSPLKLNFADLSQEDLDESLEIIDDHHMNFWNVEHLTNYLLSQLLNGTDDKFDLPITQDYEIPFKAAHNNLTFKAINKDAFSED